jgi:hypothetical protein
MALPVSGALSFNAINTELNKTATAQLSINDVDYRSLAGGQTAGTPTSLSVQYGATFNGFYVFPRQITNFDLTQDIGARAYGSVSGLVGSNGNFSWSNGGGGTITVNPPQRWYTPLTTNIASSSYDFRFVQTGWTRTGTATNDLWGWQIDTNLFGTPSSGGFDSGWMTTRNGYTVSFIQQRVTVNGSFDATATGTFQFRPKVNTSNIITFPYTFRLYAL